MFFIGSMVLLSLGYQLHFSINSTPFFLRFAKPDDLQWLMPVFWIGFNIAMFPASVIVEHRGGLIVMGAAGLLGALAVIGAEFAGSLDMLIAAQFIAGAAWGRTLMSAVAAALAIGDTGAEGKVVGLVFSALALATFARMAAVAGGLQKPPETRAAAAVDAGGMPAVAGAGLLAIAALRAQQGMVLGGWSGALPWPFDARAGEAGRGGVGGVSRKLDCKSYAPDRTSPPPTPPSRGRAARGGEKRRITASADE